MERLICGKRFTWRYLPERVTTPMHKEHRQGRGRREDQTDTGNRQQREKRGCHDVNHDIWYILRIYKVCIWFSTKYPDDLSSNISNDAQHNC